MNQARNRFILASAIIFVLASASVIASRANASFLDDLWNNIKSPFAGAPSAVYPESGQSANTVPAAALYKPTIDYENAVVAAVKKASPAVVAITISKNVPILESCPGQSPFSDIPPEFQQFFGDLPQFNANCPSGKTELQEVGGGSGFIINSNGLILTNRHVVSDASASYTIFTNDGKKYAATVLARDPSQDLAVLKINASGLPTLTLGDSDSLNLGQSAIAIGNALGEFKNTVSVGVISGLSRTITASGGATSETIQGVIQTDAAINPGNSGGPLLNLRGEVVGINTAVAQGAQNIGFAIPINRAKRDIESVRATGSIKFPYLGVRSAAVTAELAKADNLGVDYGAILRPGNNVPAVAPNSPAAKAGLAEGDIILEVNGRKIDPDNLLSNVIAGYNPGDTVVLSVRRSGENRTVSVILGERPAGA